MSRVGRPRKNIARKPCGKVRHSMASDHNSKYIYVIAFMDGAGCKIGISGNTKQRLVALQTGNHRELRIFFEHKMNSENAILLEKEIHKNLSKTISHKRGEWYDIWPNTAVFIVKNAIEKNAPRA